MSAKPASPKRVWIPDIGDEAVTHSEIERFLADRHDEVEAKLAEARKRIVRGDVAPLERLPTLLRGARQSAKAAR